MPYSRYYPGGWQDSPSVSTPIIAAALGRIESGVESSYACWNPKDPAYGAKFDGSTDDTTAIQAALTACAAAGGGTVACPPGTAIISQTLQAGSNVTLAGAGMGATVIKAKNSFAATQVGSNPGMVMICTAGNTSASRIRITGLTLDMNEANIASVPGYATAALCSPLGIQNVTGLVIERVEVLRAIGYSVFPWGCTDVRITGCRILAGQANNGYANQDGIHVTDCTGVRIDGNYIDTGTIAGIGDDGIAIQGVSAGCADVTITGNVIEHAATHGITLVLGGATLTNVAITGNIVKNCINEGLMAPFYTTYVASGTYLLTDVAVTGNVFKSVATNGTASGITLQDAYGGTGAHAGTAGYSGVAIAGNMFDTAATSGIGIYAQAGSDLAINDNTFRNWGSARGICIGDNSASTSRPVANAEVSGNTLDMSGTAQATPAGVTVVDSPNAVVTDNSITGPGTGVAGGIGVSLLSIGTAITGAVVNGNRARAWATGISETNNGAAPDYNVYAGNNLHGCTAFLSQAGTHDVLTNLNVVA